MSKVYVHDYRSGFRGSYSTFRITWDVDGRAEDVNMRKRYWQQRRDQGLSGSEIVKGASARDDAVSRAQRAILDHAERVMTCYVIEARDNNGTWDPRHVGDVLYWRTADEAKSCLDDLVDQGANRDDLRVVMAELPEGAEIQ